MDGCRLATSMAARQAPRTDILQGTLDMLILQTLRWGPTHGYSIAQAIRSASNDAFRVETGSLYPALHRLEQRRLVRARGKTSDNKHRPREYPPPAPGPPPRPPPPPPRRTIARAAGGRGGARVDAAAGTGGMTMRWPGWFGRRRDAE